MLRAHSQQRAMHACTTAAARHACMQSLRDEQLQQRALAATPAAPRLTCRKSMSLSPCARLAKKKSSPSCMSRMLMHCPSAPARRMSCSRYRNVRLCGTCWRTCGGGGGGGGERGGGRAACGQAGAGQRCVLVVSARMQACQGPRCGWQQPVGRRPCCATHARLEPHGAARARAHALLAAHLHARRPGVWVCVGAVALEAHVVFDDKLDDKALLQDGAVEDLCLDGELHLEPLAVRLRPDEAGVHQLHLLLGGGGGGGGWAGRRTCLSERAGARAAWHEGGFGAGRACTAQRSVARAAAGSQCA